MAKRWNLGPSFPDDLRSAEWSRFVEIEPFTRQWARLGLGDDDLQALQGAIIRSPEVGDVVRGAGGVRKVRFAPPGRGKSGAYRVFYANLPGHGVVFLMTTLSKGDRGNLNKADRNALAGRLAVLRDLIDKGGL